MHIVHTIDDIYFPPELVSSYKDATDDVNRIASHATLPGEHDELAIRPNPLLEHAFAQL